MKTIRRLFYIGVAILLVFASLTACAPQQEEELTELDLIKAEWQRYVVDRTEEMYAVGVGGSSPSSVILPIREQSVIYEILDICQTLNTADLTASEDPTETWDRCDLNVVLLMQEPPDTRSIYIYMYESGEAYLQLETASINYWVYISNWQVYEKLEKYRSY